MKMIADMLYDIYKTKNIPSLKNYILSIPTDNISIIRRYITNNDFLLLYNEIILERDNKKNNCNTCIRWTNNMSLSDDELSDLLLSDFDFMDFIKKWGSDDTKYYDSNDEDMLYLDLLKCIRVIIKNGTRYVMIKQEITDEKVTNKNSIDNKYEFFLTQFNKFTINYKTFVYYKCKKEEYHNNMKIVSGTVEKKSTWLFHMLEYESTFWNKSYSMVPYSPLEKNPLQNTSVINIFRGLRAKLIAEENIDISGITPIFEHIYNIWCMKNAEIYIYTLSWLAYSFQYMREWQPAYLLWGPEGNGKSIIIRLLVDYIYGNYV